MKQDRLERETAFAFFGFHRAPQQVEAIGFRGGTGMRIDRQDHSRFMGRDPARRLDRRTVVRIDSDENPVVRILPTVQRVSDHRADHVSLVPCGHQNGDSSGVWRVRHRGRRHTRMARVDGKPAPNTAAQEQDIYQQVVDPADKKPRHREEKNLAMSDRQKGDQHFPQNIDPLSLWERVMP